MGMLVEGRWTNEDRGRSDSDGEFVRPVSPFREWIGTPSGPSGIEGTLRATSGRYHLFVNAGCPWAYRTILYRSIKSLQEHISLSFTQPAMGPEGWTFGNEPDPILGARHIHDIYTCADEKFTGRTTVPVLWDFERGTIVNNESADIIRMLNGAFDHLPGVDGANYYPAERATEIDALNARIYEKVNNGVYRCGFAESQEAYDAAFDRLFDTLDELDRLLSEQRFLCGETVTEADWRLFATLVRFDAAYHGQFRCNRNLLTDFEFLWPYARDLYQHPGVAETVDFDAIKGIYYGSRPPGILPKGPALDFTAPHGRG
jgi:putative glutathione S-transferase